MLAALRGLVSANEPKTQAQATVLLDFDGTLVSGFGRKATVLPGAKEAIRFLRRRGHRMVLYGTGDRSSHIVRLRQAGIPLRWFDGICTVSRKDPEAFEQAVAGYPPPVVAVGDSWMNDVAPALGRADAVIWVRGRQKPGASGTPENVADYPVTVVSSIGSLQDVFDAALSTTYDKSAWLDYWRREFGHSDPGPRQPFDPLPVMDADGGDLAERARIMADRVRDLADDVLAAHGEIAAERALLAAENALLAAADALDEYAQARVEAAMAERL